ncbi:MAG: hypothetical protein CVT88_07310 [Candidatus Altiarchaeales archaeon HGW-Altiarchaeales-1]|nr:MAG: hypothetical protein CVT88_07310 [Candidatus Altiarchaeales archaeon HGW-Altiarchaeales-1]
MEKFHKFDLEENLGEKQKYIDEGWIETKLTFAAKDKTEAGEFFALAVENFETKRTKPIRISFHEIQQSPFVGAIIINTLIYDIEELIRLVLNFAPVAVEIKKERVELSLVTLNQIFLDISDIVKTFEHLSKMEIYSKDTNIESAEIYANVILEFHHENRELVEERMNDALNKIKAIANVISQNRDEILEEYEEAGGNAKCGCAGNTEETEETDERDETERETEKEAEKKKFYFGNVEMELKANLFAFVDIITQFKPVSIEAGAPHSMTMSRDEIYTLIGKLLLITQRHTERIVQSKKVADES